jgi:hypothetical protein
LFTSKIHKARITGLILPVCRRKEVMREQIPQITEFINKKKVEEI